MITTVLGVPNHLVASNSIGGNGGGSLTNEYSLLIDMHSPVGSRGTWRALYQTNPANTGDGDLFIRNSDTRVGVSTIGYAPAINDTVWNRYVVAFDAGNPVRAYLNGTLFHTHSASAVDDRFGLNTTFLLFGDEDNENNALNIGTVAFWNGALTDSEVAALGFAGSPVPEPAGALLLALTGAAALVRRRR
ncbi:MAG: LamG-like jellyroll fold domain-containing protein [Verrucomicrobiales bacterium]